MKGFLVPVISSPPPTTTDLLSVSTDEFAFCRPHYKGTPTLYAFFFFFFNLAFSLSTREGPSLLLIVQRLPVDLLKDVKLFPVRAATCKGATDIHVPMFLHTLLELFFGFFAFSILVGSPGRLSRLSDRLFVFGSGCDLAVREFKFRFH